MYRKQDPNQLMLEGFVTPFGKLAAGNRWVKQAELTPWDYIEEVYAKNFSPNSGTPALSARIAYGALYVSEKMKLTDRETVEYIAENPYAQYFLGLSEFRQEELFDASMMVHFRKRFPAEVINEINLYMHSEPAGMKGPEEIPEADEAPGVDETPEADEAPEAAEACDENDEEIHDPTTNKGKLLLDATCAPSDIRYPSDISLLNEARANLEDMIDELWHLTPRKGHKTDYSRKKAHKGYLAIIKQKQPRRNKLRKEIRYQLDCVGKSIATIGNILLEHGLEVLPEKRIIRLIIICELHRQQLKMYNGKSHSVENRIVNLRQPHIRPIVRGKAGKKYEFGQKISTSVVNGYTFIEQQSYDNFNEGVTLQESVERYKARFGHYPEAVLADKLYRNRENLRYCKKWGIRLSGPPLGRPRKQASKDAKRIARQDNAERNMVESRYGITKRRYSLARIMAYLPETGKTQAAMQFLCMNVDVRLRALASFIFSLVKPLFYRAFFENEGVSLA